MQLSPRYEGRAIIEFTAGPVDLSVPLLRQRRRLAGVLAGLSDEQWATASRCEGWTVRDVVSHLVTTDQFWVLSASAALGGEPTRFLAGFDPVATPALLVDRAKEQSPTEVLAAFQAGVDAFADLVSDLGPEQWAMPAEAPPGHIALHAMVRHALWDCWVHERDILGPLGLEQEIEPDEVRAALEYAAALNPGFTASIGGGRTGTLAVLGTDPDVRLLVRLDDAAIVSELTGDVPEGAVTIGGPAIALLEALSVRAPYPCDVAESDRWLVSGLATVFDNPPPG